MKVLSLFDGMSCGQLALQRVGIKVDKYYASEIDKYAIQVTQANFPNTIQIGDVKAINPKDYLDIDLIICGSPCQGFSFAGKQLAFDDPRSALFFEFIRILKEVKPKYFLLENVRMKQQFQDIITEQVSACYPDHKGNDLFDSKIEPILINSSLLSAQSRQRLYWTNIPNVKQPEDLGIVLKDILEDDYGSERDKSYCIDANYFKGASVEQYQKKSRRQLVNKPIKVGMNVEEVKVRKHKIDVEHLQRFLEVYKKRSKKTQKQIATELDVPLTQVSHWFRTDSCFSIPPAELWLALRKVINADNDSYDKKIMEFEYRDGVYETKQRVYSDQGKAPTLTASNKEQMIETSTSDNGITNIKKGTSGKSWFFEQQTYSKDSKKTRSLKAGGGSGNIPKVLETKPKQVGKIKDGGQGNRIYSTDGKSSTLSAQSGGTAGNGNTLIETKPKQVGIASDINGHDILKRVYSPEGKSPTLNTMGGGNREPKVVSGALRARSKNKAGKNVGWKETKPKQMLELRKDEKANSVTSVSKDSVVVNEELTWRKLTPLECERLQTVPDNYTASVSNTQRYKMLGNGFTVSVIAHILKNI